MENVDTTALGTSAVIATILIPIVSIVKKPTWSTRYKYLVGMVAAIIAAVGGTIIDGEFSNGQEFLVSLTTALATSQTLYNVYFRDTQVNATLENIGNV